MAKRGMDASGGGPEAKAPRYAAQAGQGVGGATSPYPSPAWHGPPAGGKGAGGAGQPPLVAPVGVKPPPPGFGPRPAPAPPHGVKAPPPGVAAAKPGPAVGMGPPPTPAGAGMQPTGMAVAPPAQTQQVLDYIRGVMEQERQNARMEHEHETRHLHERLAAMEAALQHAQHATQEETQRREAAERHGHMEHNAAYGHATRARAEYEARVAAEQKCHEEQAVAEQHARQARAEYEARCQFESLAARPAPTLAPGRLPALPTGAVRVYPAEERADTPPGWVARQCVGTHLRPEVYRNLDSSARPACGNPQCRRQPTDTYWVACRGCGHNFCWPCFALTDPAGAAAVSEDAQARRRRQLQRQQEAAAVAAAREDRGAAMEVEGAEAPPPRRGTCDSCELHQAWRGITSDCDRCRGPIQKGEGSWDCRRCRTSLCQRCAGPVGAAPRELTQFFSMATPATSPRNAAAPGGQEAEAGETDRMEHAGLEETQAYPELPTEHSQVEPNQDGAAAAGGEECEPTQIEVADDEDTGGPATAPPCEEHEEAPREEGAAAPPLPLREATADEGQGPPTGSNDSWIMADATTAASSPGGGAGEPGRQPMGGRAAAAAEEDEHEEQRRLDEGEAAYARESEREAEAARRATEYSPTSVGYDPRYNDLDDEEREQAAGERAGARAAADESGHGEPTSATGAAAAGAPPSQAEGHDVAMQQSEGDSAQERAEPPAPVRGSTGAGADEDIQMVEETQTSESYELGSPDSAWDIMCTGMYRGLQELSDGSQRELEAMPSFGRLTEEPRRTPHLEWKVRQQIRWDAPTEEEIVADRPWDLLEVLRTRPPVHALRRQLARDALCGPTNLRMALEAVVGEHAAGLEIPEAYAALRDRVAKQKAAELRLDRDDLPEWATVADRRGQVDQGAADIGPAHTRSSRRARTVAEVHSLPKMHADHLGYRRDWHSSEVRYALTRYRICGKAAYVLALFEEANLPWPVMLPQGTWVWPWTTGYADGEMPAADRALHPAPPELDLPAPNPKPNHRAGGRLPEAWEETGDDGGDEVEGDGGGTATAAGAAWAPTAPATTTTGTAAGGPGGVATAPAAKAPPPVFPGTALGGGVAATSAAVALQQLLGDGRNLRGLRHGGGGAAPGAAGTAPGVPAAAEGPGGADREEGVAAEHGTERREDAAAGEERGSRGDGGPRAAWGTWEEARRGAEAPPASSDGDGHGEEAGGRARPEEAGAAAATAEPWRAWNEAQRRVAVAAAAAVAPPGGATAAGGGGGAAWADGAGARPWGSYVHPPADPGPHGARSLSSIYDGPLGRRRPDPMQRGDVRNRWRDYPGACLESDGRALLLWRAFERVLPAGQPEVFVPLEEVEQVARLGYQAARALLQFRRRHDGSRCFVVGGPRWAGQPAVAYGDGHSGPTTTEAWWQPFRPVDGAVVARSPGPSPTDEAALVRASPAMREEMESRRREIEDAYEEAYRCDTVYGRR